MATEKKTLFCEKCLQTLDSKKFYQTYNLEKFPTGHLNLCKDCLTMHVNNFDPDTYVWILEDCDVPYIPEEWYKILTSYSRNNKPITGKSILGRYLSRMRIQQFSGFRWKDSDPINSLATPIGINEYGELFKLDLHEKAHGPHGLIAGMTGSGKSEFIITYILSLAMNYSPDDVAFILIDYKGGGLAGVFQNKETGMKLPHLAGTITNLDTNEMSRSLASIQSELRKRQRMFNEARDALNESSGNVYFYSYENATHDSHLDEYIKRTIEDFNKLPDYLKKSIALIKPRMAMVIIPNFLVLLSKHKFLLSSKDFLQE